MKKILILIGALLASYYSYSQTEWELGGNNNFQLLIQNNQRIGPLLNVPFRLITAGQQRMHINPNGTFANGTNTSGFIGIGNYNPFSLLHIVGSQNANAQGWNRGVTLSDNAILQWDGGGGN